jgi:hypothetical protein
MIRSSLLRIFALALFAAGPAGASSFCVEVTGIPPQCLYADPAICQSEANHAGGRCVANPEVFKVPAGQSPFCVVESGDVISCVYGDLASCRADAERRHGACLAAPPPPTPHYAPDPYAIKRPY